MRFVYNSNMLDPQAITLSDVRRKTAKDDTLSKLIAQIQSGKWSRDDKVKPFKTIQDELSVYERDILRGNRILVPFLLCKKILKLSHKTHQGIVKTKQFLRSKFFWPGMDEAIEAMIKILPRMRSESTTEQVHAASTISVTSWSLDKKRSGHSWFNWREIYSDLHRLLFISDRACAARNHFTQCHSSIDRFGFPEELVYDNGKKFLSTDFEAFLKPCGIKHASVSSYYARSNGKLKRFHRYLNENFRAAISESKSWEGELPKILISILLFNREIRMKVPHVESCQNNKFDQEISSKSNSINCA